MKIIITERQKKLITEKIDENKLRDFCYKLWNKQKEMGEEPHIDDIIYQVSGIEERSSEDYYVIRPIWYEYNGGFGNLMDKVENQILGKTFELHSPSPGLDAKFKVKEVELELNNTFPTKYVNIICEVDKDGMIDYESYDDEVGQVFLKRDTIEQAIYELEYEQEELEEYLKGEIYNILEPFTDEKYGIPIVIDIEYTDFN